MEILVEKLNKENIMDKKFKRLKTELFACGINEIEEFCGVKIEDDWTNEEIDNLMNDVMEQMPEEELEKFYKKFSII